MANVALHRQRLVQTAIRLFREKGYAGTGLSEILELSGAPKGSLYYYFPGGKEALAVAAMEAAGEKVIGTLSKIAETEPDPGAFIAAYCQLLAAWMQASNYKAGCPITTTILETVPQSAALSEIARQVFTQWETVVAEVYRRSGMNEKQAVHRAGIAIAAIEGALIQARVRSSSLPLERVAEFFQEHA